MLQNLERLKVFYHVFAEESVVAAAKTLHVSQSAVSQTLQKLENEVKCPLFTRLHKRLVPTTAGQRLFAVVSPFMADLDTCLKTLEQAKNKPFGELRIGAPTEFGKAYLPAIAAAFREQYPEVSFYLKFGDAGTLLPMVEKGRLDIALVDEFLTQTPFFTNLDIYHFTPIVEEEVVLACSKRYYAQRVRNDHSFENLSRQDFITFGHNDQTVKNWFRHHFGSHNVPANMVLIVDSLQAIISAIRHHLGLGVIASHLVSEEIRKGRIIPIETAKEKIINTISMVNLQEKVPTLAEKVFARFLEERIQSMGL